MKPGRALFPALLAVVLLSAAPVGAKFGIIKTHVTFLLRHPPAFYTPARELSLDVTSLDPRGGPLVVPQLLQALQDDLRREDFRVNHAARTALRLTLTEAAAFVEQHTWLESMNVHVGERIEKDAKGKEMTVEDCKVEQAQVVYLVSSGGLFVDLTATDQKAQTVLFSQPVQKQYWDESPVSGPKQCGGREYGLRSGQMKDPAAILARIAEQVAAVTLPLVAGFDEPREVLLAVDDELKIGNTLAQLGQWEQALAAWKGASIRVTDTEAARQYNLGVAYEALAAAAMRSEQFEQARQHLDKAAEAYDRAVALDPKEKYFREPFERLRQDRDLLQRFEENQSSPN